MSDSLTISKAFPKEQWETVRPAEVGMNAEKVAQVQRWFADALSDKKGRLVIVRGGGTATAERSNSSEVPPRSRYARLRREEAER